MTGNIEDERLAFSGLFRQETFHRFSGISALSALARSETNCVIKCEESVISRSLSGSLILESSNNYMF